VTGTNFTYKTAGVCLWKQPVLSNEGKGSWTITNNQGSWWGFKTPTNKTDNKSDWPIKAPISQ